MLLVDEYFDRADPRFVETLRKTWLPKPLAPFAARWARDPRPWAREALFQYLAMPWNCPGHQPLLKRLFKHAEEAGDDALLAVFFVEFDRLIRRVRRSRWKWDQVLRRGVEEERLEQPHNKLPTEPRGRIRSPLTGQEISLPAKVLAARPFTCRTRYYLRRRVGRHFRRLAFQQPERYVPGLARCLVQYRDEDFAKGEHVLDNYSLMRAGFRHHPALEFGTAKVWVRDGHSLGELTAAPAFPELWQAPSALEPMVDIVRRGQARLIRLWAIGLLKRDHAGRLADYSAESLLNLFESADPDVQAFASELLEAHTGLGAVPMATWSRLLATASPTALDSLCRLIERHVPPTRLTLADCVDLACAESTPVANLGLTFLKSKTVATGEDREHAARLSHAKCGAAGRRLATWGLSWFATPGNYHRDLVQWFFDSPTEEVRAGAWDWLTPDVPAYDDPVLWSRLLESPWDDLRLKLIDVLARRSTEDAPTSDGASARSSHSAASSTSTSSTTSSSATRGGERPAARPFPRPSAAALAPLWCTVLAGVHRGGRRKLSAVRQVAEAIERDPNQAGNLLPVLAVAARSVRKPESREALSALLGMIERRPELTDTVRAALPELTFV